ncbi:MAG: hypothetical protein IPH77_07920 [Ignavibacteria bacterium]|nr:hypothetical protein [Ignavibacteria bacterium]
MKDTVTIYLRNISPPYSNVDSAISVIDSVNLTGSFLFNTAPSGTYYLVVRHRNTLETWSKSGGETYNANTVFRYDFTSSSSQAFGNNMILNGTRWCIYSGDVDQDGVIDASDMSKVDNDASASVSGYNSTDLDGDYLTDSNDLSILDNNLQFSKIVVKP